MKALLNAAVLYGLATQSSAHWVNSHLIINGKDTGHWKHVLDVGNPWGEYPAKDEYSKMGPLTDGEQFSDAVICGRQAFKSLEQTEIADITAGEEVAFMSATGKEMYGENGQEEPLHYYHPGPGSIWLSRAPNDDVKSYKGDGDWFKIDYAGPANNTAWKLNYESSYPFTIPKTTPPGQYLLRVEIFMPTPTRNYTQWFVNCALVNIKGSGGGKPEGFAKFPGHYKPDDLALWIPFNQSVGDLPVEQMAVLDYKEPTPLVWKG